MSDLSLAILMAYLNNQIAVDAAMEHFLMRTQALVANLTGQCELVF